MMTINNFKKGTVFSKETCDCANYNDSGQILFLIRKTEQLTIHFAPILATLSEITKEGVRLISYMPGCGFNEEIINFGDVKIITNHPKITIQVMPVEVEENHITPSLVSVHVNAPRDTRFYRRKQMNGCIPDMPPPP